jgi:hypothetical protein
MPKSFKEAFCSKDWWGPLSEASHTVFLLLLDGVRILALMGFAEIVKHFFSLWGVPAIAIGEFEIHASQILKNFDYVLFVLFLLIQGWHLVLGMVKS